MIVYKVVAHAKDDVSVVRQEFQNGGILETILDRNSSQLSEAFVEVAFDADNLGLDAYQIKVEDIRKNV